MKHLPEFLDAVQSRDLREFVNLIGTKHADRNAFVIKHKVKKEVSYEYITYKEFRDDIEALAAFLNSKGFSKKKIAVIGVNSYPWLVTYLATVAGVGISIPLDKDLPFEELESSLIRSSADAVFFDKKHSANMEEIKANNNTQLTAYFELEKIREYIEEGKKLIEAGDKSFDAHEIDPKAMSIMLFTSGTTSQSKIVMLSQENITSNIYGLNRSIDIKPEDTNMAFLPYHHTFGSTGQLVMLSYGTCTAYCDGLKYLQKNLVEYQISVFICVPLLVEGIYKKVMAAVKKQGKENLVNNMGKLCSFLEKFGINIRRKVFKSVLDQLGGKIRLVIVGASAIDKEALAGFQRLGVTTLQGYGLTETSPVLTAECTKTLRTGSVGYPMCNVDIKIDNPNEEGIGEILAKGPNIMLGYYNNEEENKKVFTEDGWFRTGDLGRIDKDGYLFICGREKNVIVLKNGKNIYPEELESLIASLPYVEENMVFGAERKNDNQDLTISAKIIYNKEYVKTHFGDITEEELEKIIKKDIDKINEQMPVYKQIKRIYITDVPAIKTSTAKIKRHEEIKTIVD